MSEKMAKGGKNSKDNGEGGVEDEDKAEEVVMKAKSKKGKKSKEKDRDKEAKQEPNDEEVSGNIYSETKFHFCLFKKYFPISMPLSLAFLPNCWDIFSHLSSLWLLLGRRARREVKRVGGKE